MATEEAVGANAVAAGQAAALVATDRHREPDKPTRRRVRWSRGGIFFALIAVYALAAFTAPGFFAHDNQLNVLRNVSVLGVMAVGQTVVAISGGLADVSSGSVVSLCAVLALGLQGGLGTVGAAIVALSAGVALGFMNGFLVGPWGANPVVATIGTGVVIEGIALGYTGGNTQYGRSSSFANLGSGSIGGIPTLVIAFFAVALIVHLVARYSALGFRLSAVGGNLESARASGLRVRSLLASAFVLSGVAAAIGGIMQAALLNQVNYDSGTSYTFTSVAAVAIGGTSLFGGEGSVIRTIGGVALLGVLDNVVILYGWPLALQTLVTGGVILVAVVVDTLVRRGRRA